MISQDLKQIKDKLFEIDKKLADIKQTIDDTKRIERLEKKIFGAIVGA